MKSIDLLQRWRLPLSERLGRSEELILENGILASDFTDSGVHIVFEDGSDLTFRRAFFLGEIANRRADQSICRVAVLSEHVGHHEFWIGPDDHIEAVIRNREALARLLSQYDPNAPKSEEEEAWDNVAPVGREFGSPDYDRLMEEDRKNLASNLASLIEMCREPAGVIELEKSEYDDAVNVQLAIQELGQEVSVAIAGAVWMHHSKSLMASWMSGAETVASAKKAVFFYCFKGQFDGKS